MTSWCHYPIIIPTDVWPVMTKSNNLELICMWLHVPRSWANSCIPTQHTVSILGSASSSSEVCYFTAERCLHPFWQGIQVTLLLEYVVALKLSQPCKQLILDPNTLEHCCAVLIVSSLSHRSFSRGKRQHAITQAKPDAAQHETATCHVTNKGKILKRET